MVSSPPETMHYQLIATTDADQPWLDGLRRAVYLDLFVATWGGWDEARHKRHLAACLESGHIFAIEVGGQRVGMIQLLEHPDELEVGEMQIEPAHQGQGIGTRVLLDTLARAKAEGRKVLLSTGLQNLRAVKLYERLGFQHVAQSDTHFHMELSQQA